MFTLVTLVVLMGFAALTVDVGAMYNAKADLQRTADAAALAAASKLTNYTGNDALDVGTEVASQIVAANKVLGSEVSVSADDVIFGRASLNQSGNGYSFTPTNTFPNAIRVRVSMAEGSSNGALQLFFARAFGINSTDMAAQATASLVPRDIAVVADLSASHTDDSELYHLGDIDINLFDVWANLPVERGNNGVGNGIDPPPPGNPNSHNDEPGTGPGNPGNQGGNDDPGANPGGGQVGPTWGWMYYWGNDLDDSYDPTTDPGLIHLPRYENWDNDDLVTWYENVGYSDDEIDALISSSYDNYGGGTAHWTSRVAVALGLARWDSGIPGGLWDSIPPGRRNNNGNANTYVSGNELTWLVDFPYDSGSWEDFIYNYMRSSNTRMAQNTSDFQYRFGLKTFVNYRLEWYPSHEQTEDLAQTPHQPMQAVKDAVTHLAETLSEAAGTDQMSLEIYATEGRHEINLTTDYMSVAERLNEMQAGHYDGYTNMGAGIMRAREELGSGRHNDVATKMIFLMTDGFANVACDGCTQYDESGGRQFALEQAAAAAAENIQIYAISVGSNYDADLMDDIAAMGGGQHLHAEGSIEEYSAELRAIFRNLGGLRGVSLIE